MGGFNLRCVSLSLLALAAIPFLTLLFIPMLALPRLDSTRTPTHTREPDDDYETAWNINDTLAEVAPALFEDHLKDLRPAAGAIDLAKWLKRDRRGGWCNSPLASSSSSDACRPVTCLTSILNEPIDLTHTPLRTMSGPCGTKPEGGQLAYRPGQPVIVSFILTLHNNDGLAAQTLLELLRTAQEVQGAIQFCVNDDGSDEDPVITIATLTAFRSLFGLFITYQRNVVPLGFGEANNKAAEWAQGAYIALINTDMFVTPGWICALLFTFSAFRNVGMVGPLYMGEGNLVTEAGGIVFRDASAANYGRSFSLHHEYLYTRKVDYISAACVLIPKHAWQLVGGFDLRYEKGYYEDTDMAMALRREGMEVYFQPGSIVYHQEGHTFGSDSPLKLRLMAENKAKFIEKWQSQLERDHMLVGSGDFQAASIQRYSDTLLWLVPRALLSEDGAGSRRARKIAQRMQSKGIHLTLQPLEGVELILSHGREILEARIMGCDVLDPETSGAINGEGSFPMSSLESNGGCSKYNMFMVSGLGLLARVNRSLRESCPLTPMVIDLASSESSPLIPPHQYLANKGSGMKSLSNRKITLGRYLGGSPDIDSQSSLGQIVTWIEKNLDSKSSEGLTYRLGLSFIQQASSVMVSSDLERQAILSLLPHLRVSNLTSLHIVT